MNFMLMIMSLFYVIVRSFINIRYVSVAAKSIPQGRNEQRSVICFRWAKGLSANAIQSEMLSW